MKPLGVTGSPKKGAFCSKDLKRIKETESICLGISKVMKEVEQKNPKNERLVAKSRGGKKKGHELKGRVEMID
jgi:hypothetical protein